MNNAEAFYMTYQELKEITEDFSDGCLIGRGAFGKVYKGKDKDGHELAVKILHQTLDLDGNLFTTEFNNLIKLKHPNIVRLVGFCSEDEEVIKEYNGRSVAATDMHRVLCFEYLHNGSLQKHLYEEHQGFDWQRRYTIIKGICMGLKYLHMELESPMHHLDLKPDNILLGNDMVPKIADFGLSRLLGEENTKKTLSPLGTLGYCPPEFLKDQLISKEFDIFSLGVIILKIICGPAGYSLAYNTRSTKFIKKVQKNWRERLQTIQGYTSLEDDCQQVKKCLEIALKCIDEEKQKRPNIGSIINQLVETEKHKNDTVAEVGSLRGSSPVSLGKLTMNFMKEITNDFHPALELGHSVFGTTYKGTLPEGSMIAVRRLHENSAAVVQGKTFDTEVANLMALQHENIVKLVGFCHETQTQLVHHNERNIIVDILESYLCYEYLSKGSLDKYVYAPSAIDWDTRFKIIKGICKGIHFLHQELDGPLVHLNLVPNSIWLDDNWMPKIADFGLSRLFGAEQTRLNTINVVGQRGYMAPEYLYRGEISTMSDIYSLGMLIVEITTAEDNNNSSSSDRSARKFVENVREKWTDEHIASKYLAVDANGLQQVKECLAIGLKCLEINRKNRPSILEVVHIISALDLNKRRSLVENISKNNARRQMKPVSTMLLDVYPEELCFPFKRNMLISCSLQLTNTTEDCISVRLGTKTSKKYMTKMPLCGVVPPRSTYTIIVTTREQEKQPPSNSEEFFTLASSIVQGGDLRQEAATNNQVYQLTLNVVSDPLEEQPPQSEIQIISIMKYSQVLSMDVHPTEPWIMTSHLGGDIFIWDYQERKIEVSFSGGTNIPVYSAKFIEREEWLVAGDGYGTICVYSYDTEEQVAKIEAHEGEITSLAVHPTGPLVLSASDDHLIKLWAWDEKGWYCTRTFEGHSDTVKQVIFKTVDTNYFASTSLDHTIRIWDISSSESKIVLNDHPYRLLCVHNYTSDDRHYLITGSSDRTAQIWDMETERCVQTLKGHTDLISSVYHHPELPVVMTGSHDGTVRLWNSTTYRLENTIALNLGAIYAFGYIEGIKRVVVSCNQGIAITEINLP